MEHPICKPQSTPTAPAGTLSSPRIAPPTASSSTPCALRGSIAAPPAPPAPRAYPAEPYLTELPTDPWGADYIYRSPGANGAYDLLSYGKDGVEGGEKLDADLTERTR